MKNLTFKADDRYKKRLAKLQKKLKIDRSKVIRLAIDELYDTVMDPKKKPGDIVLAEGYSYRLAIQSAELASKSIGILHEISDSMDDTFQKTVGFWTAAKLMHQENIDKCNKALVSARKLLAEGGSESNETK